MLTLEDLSPERPWATYPIGANVVGPKDDSSMGLVGVSIVGCWVGYVFVVVGAGIAIALPLTWTR
jgi:hypothetical protein